MNLEELNKSRDESIPLGQSHGHQIREDISDLMLPLDHFIRDLDERKGKIPCCQEVTDIQNSVENVLKDLLLEVENVHPFLKTTLINSGSFYEGTKVGQPDEFDYFVQLDNLSEATDILVDELPRSNVVVIPSVSGFRKMTVSLCPNFDWKERVKAPFVRTLDIKADGFEAYGMKISRVSKRHGPAYCLELEWTGENLYRGLKISVDLSLAVKINSRSTTMDLDLETPAGKVIKSLLDSLPYYYAVSAYNHLFDGCPDDESSDLFSKFKASDLGCSITLSNVLLRCSQSCLEHALFRHFGQDGGPTVCLRVLKVLRDMMFPDEIEEESFVRNVGDIVMHHWSFLADRLSEGAKSISSWMRKANDDIGDDINTMSSFFSIGWISSYTLKTLVLLEWEQNPAEEQWAGRNLSQRFLDILKNLRLSLTNELHSFFYRDYKISPSGRLLGSSWKTAIVGRITILVSLLLSIRDATDEYRFEECLETMITDLKWSCQKVKLYSFLLYALLDLFDHELEKVISSILNKESATKKNFCSIYIQALLEKIAVEVKLILPEPERLAETDRVSKPKELFKEIVSARMKGLVNLPSFKFSLQAFESDELAKLLQFLYIIFKKDIEILLDKL